MRKSNLNTSSLRGDKLRAGIGAALRKSRGQGLGELISKAQAESAGQETAAHAPVAADVQTVRKLLSDLQTQAVDERLECAVPLIESLRLSLALDRASASTPPGALTVKGWMSLLNGWESHLEKMRQRQINYSKSFFEEAVEEAELGASPLAPMLQQLVEMCRGRLAQDGQSAA
ncbi:hypothetical protein [Magnetofaba australis]|uniref:Uncharacterized protein n=1 Tax=Magnetofaba australis IT-1 TaxID=1434232 RepID=A0A1Y2K5I8_9PROT|nr:hypothetical protein [Magnetofaba australis]OSM04962.1 hypothetical protein MAIT1_03082 [Magnetofaba australis IT-1]